VTRSRIYTRTGDTGETGLFGGGRVSKSHPRVSAYGEVDELNAWLGWAFGQVKEGSIRVRLAGIQPDLFTIGAHLATPAEPRGRPPALPALPAARAAQFEQWIDEADDELPELRTFILPGGTAGASALHVARTVCRRAERAVIALKESEDVAAEIVVYLNRLSDLLFAWARLENHRAGVSDIPWQPPASE
jgi:cob(I)alamin adenosyltransferase